MREASLPYWDDVASLTPQSRPPGGPQMPHPSAHRRGYKLDIERGGRLRQSVDGRMDDVEGETGA